MGIIKEVISGADELWQWLLALEPSFAFLLALPLVVAVAGFLRYWFDKRQSRHAPVVTR